MEIQQKQILSVNHRRKTNERMVRIYINLNDRRLYYLVDSHMDQSVYNPYIRKMPQKQNLQGFSLQK